MVVFDKLEITPNGEQLIVKAHVPKDVDNYLQNVYIKKLVITSDLNPTSGSMPSDTNDHILFYYDFGNEDEDTGQLVYPKNVECVIPAYIAKMTNIKAWQDINNFSSHIFYVWIETAGEASELAPCKYHNTKDVGIVINNSELFNLGYSFVKDLANTCNTNTNFINFILQYNAFKLAVELQNTYEAERLYKLMNRIKTGVYSTKKCCCNG